MVVLYTGFTLYANLGEYKKLGNSSTNQYKKLTINTLLLAMGTFGSKVINLVMTSFYTGVFDASKFGITSQLMNYSNLLITLCTLGMTSAVIRFGLDKRYRKSDVYSTSLVCLFLGFSFCLTFFPVVTMFQDFKDYVVHVYLYVLASSFHALTGQFVRSQEKIRIYAISCLINTFTNASLMIIFLRFLSLGIHGYLFAVILADAVTGGFLFVAGKCWRHVKLTSFKLPTSFAMLRYALPMIPNAISWWIINASDQFMIGAMVNNAAVGLYTVATRIPNLISIVGNVFIDAWQVSFIGTDDREERSRFFSNILSSYQSLLFIGASVLIITAKISTKLLAQKESYVSAWEPVSFLVLAVIFTCLSSFLGTVYIYEHKSGRSLLTSSISAVSNIAVNLLLIPFIGIIGAAIATCFSSVLMFVLRLVDTRKYLKLTWSLPKFLSSLALLLAQAVVMTYQIGPYYIIQAACFAAIAAINVKSLIAGAMKILKRKSRKTA